MEPEVTMGGGQGRSGVERARELADRIGGWLTPAEGAFLFRSAAACTGRGAIVEIGSWKGKSTVWLGRGSLAGPNAKVVAIDPHYTKDHVQRRVAPTLEEFRRNVREAGIDGIVEERVATSEEVARTWRGPVELLWIDGDHAYESVRQDFHLWAPFLSPGGTIAFHDTGKPGPRCLVEEVLYRGRSFRRVGFVDSITYATKVPRASIRDLARTRAVYWVRYAYYEGPRLRLPRPLRRAGRWAIGRVQRRLAQG